MMIIEDSTESRPYEWIDAMDKLNSKLIDDKLDTTSHY